MGLFDMLKARPADAANTRTALEEANDPRSESSSAVSKMIQGILATGIDGKGPFPSASAVAAKARKKAGSTEQAVDMVARNHIRDAAAGGFVTGLGGFITMPVALPANLYSFYVLATRMVASIAELRGYDLSQPEVRTATLLTLVGSRSDEILKKAGAGLATGKALGLVIDHLPGAALMVINKAVGFRLLRTAGTKVLGKLGRAVPVIGGAFGGGVDAWMMNRIAAQARKEFPQR